jgi:phage I-like protein
MSREFLAKMVANWERINKAPLPVDYWHDDESPTSIASGWIEGLELRDDGLYGLIKWTAAARARILADELRCLSPSFALDGWDTTTGKRQGPTLLGAALLNQPFLFDLPRVAAGRAPSSTPHPSQENTMLRTLLLSLFAMPEVTTDEALAEAVRKLKADNLKLGNEMNEKVEFTSKPLKVELAAARETVVKLEADLAKAKSDALGVEVDAFLVKLESEKKLLPANRESAKEICLKMGMEFAKKHFGAATPIVPVGEVGIRGKGGDEAVAPEQVTQQLDDELERIRKDTPGLTYSEARKRLAAEKPELLKLAASSSAKSKRPAPEA